MKRNTPKLSAEDVRLRRREVLALTGTSEYMLDKLVRCGFLTPHHIDLPGGRSRALYSRRQVLAVFQLEDADARPVRPD
jgi:predicted DNA-binding transcriptional regulator AlpA